MARRAALVALLVLLAAGPARGQAPRPATLSWLLLPQAWVELDLELDAGGEAVASFSATGGTVAWDLHTHPPEAPPEVLVVLERGAGQTGRVRCAPERGGRYSFLWINENSEGVVRLRVSLALAGPARLIAVKP
jgi:hypothetical protein